MLGVLGVVVFVVLSTIAIQTLFLVSSIVSGVVIAQCGSTTKVEHKHKA